MLSQNSNATLAIAEHASKRHAVLEQIAAACARAGRKPDSVKLLAVSKKQPLSAIAAHYQLGQRDFGENYVQEALAKMPDLPRDIVWHHIGPLQSNKTRAVAENFAWCHGVCSLKIAQRLSAQRPAGQDPLQICIQVNLEGEASKSGLAADEAVALAEAVMDLPGLRLRGLMTLPPPQADTQQQQQQFAKVAQLLQRLPGGCNTLSMGMSGDMEAAIAAGSTMVRVGTALFGPRPPMP